MDDDDFDFLGLLSELEDSVAQIESTPNEQALEDTCTSVVLLLEDWNVLSSELKGRLNTCITRLMELGGKVSLACAVGLFLRLERRNRVLERRLEGAA